MARKKTENAVIENMETPETNYFTEDEITQVEKPKKKVKKPEMIKVRFNKTWSSPKGTYSSGKEYTIKYSDYELLVNDGSVIEV